MAYKKDPQLESIKYQKLLVSSFEKVESYSKESVDLQHEKKQVDLQMFEVQNITKMNVETQTNILKEIQWLKKPYELATNYYFPLTPNVAKILNKGKTIKSFHITKESL